MTDSWIRQGDVPRVMVPTEIFPKLTVGLPAARAYAALAKLADHQTGHVKATEDQTATEAAMSKRQANEGIRALIGAGWITRLVRGQQGRPSVYLLHTAPTRGNLRVEDAESDLQHAESRVLEHSPTRGGPRVEGGQHAEYPSVTRGNPRPSSVVEEEEDLLPRAKSFESLASEVGASKEEMNLLIEKVRRDHPHVKVPSAWLREVHRNGDLGMMLADVRAGMELKPAPPPWCRSCDERTRQVELDDGRPARCPRCHPLRRVS